MEPILTQWLPTIIAIVGVGVSWGGVAVTLKQHGKELDKLNKILTSGNGLPVYITRKECREMRDDCSGRRLKEA